MPLKPGAGAPPLKRPDPMVECPRCTHIFSSGCHAVAAAPLKRRGSQLPAVVTTGVADDLYALLLLAEEEALSSFPPSSSPSSKKQGERETSTHLSSASILPPLSSLSSASREGPAANT